MTHLSEKCNLQPSLRAAIAAFAIVFAPITVATQAAQAQTFTVLHTFTGQGDGSTPLTGLTIDAAGNLYGTTVFRGAGGFGTVFKLRYSGFGWTLTPLYSFTGGADGGYPYGRVALASNGGLYGTTSIGGQGCSNGCGTFFHLRPPPTAPKAALAPWDETVLYLFTGGSGGAYPEGDLTFDQSGNVYGTAGGGGFNDNGVIYELTPSGGGWTQTVLYTPQGDGAGADPVGGVVFDASGNLYGVFRLGGPNEVGAVYQLSPSGMGWTRQFLHSFSGGNDGEQPNGGLIIGPSGNLYGTTYLGGSGDAGTVFELTPANGGWSFNTLYGLPGGQESGPEDKLVMDAAGNLYGTTFGGGTCKKGSVFKLTPSNGEWIYSDVHDFCNGDGANPQSSVVFDTNGNLYGTASEGGNGYGVVWEITP